MGAEGFVSSFDPHVMGAEGISLFELAAAGKVSEARKVQERTLVLDTALGKIGTGPATMKTAMNILGRPGGYPRRPLQPLTAAEENQVRTVLDGLGLLKMDRAAAE
jgi:dihydrodipicolinate synthase/N-acetylneuraminate lyase